MPKSYKHKLEHDDDLIKHRKKSKNSNFKDIQQVNLDTEQIKQNEEKITQSKNLQLNKIKEIDLNSGIIDMICLKYIMTVENEAINNKIKYYSLLYDGFEYIYLEEWENSIFVKFQRNDNIILENFSFKEMDTNRYLINYNKSNIQLIKLYKSKIKLANTDIPNIEILKSINKFCDKNPKFEGKKLISFFGIITAINETSLYNKRCLNITISDMKDPKFSISFIYWKLN